jgi:hypothetical protein
MEGSITLPHRHIRQGGYSNPNFEYRKPKQVQMSNDKKSKHIYIENYRFRFVSDFVLRVFISRLRVYRKIWLRILAANLSAIAFGDDGFCRYQSGGAG